MSSGQKSAEGIVGGRQYRPTRRPERSPSGIRGVNGETRVMRLRGGKRQKNQLELAFPPMGRGEASSSGKGGTETPRAAQVCQGPAATDLLMEEVCDPGNLKRALQRVCQNQGDPGVDGMTVQVLPGYLGDHWSEILVLYLRGWIGYFGFCERRTDLRDLDGWIRRRLRSVAALALR
jgi:hypothetical protein